MLFSKQPFCFSSLECPHAPVLLTESSQELSPADRWNTRTGLKRGGAGRSSLPDFLSCSLTLLGSILQSSEVKHWATLSGDPERDPKQLSNQLYWHISLSAGNTVKTPFFLTSAPLQNPFPGFLKNKTPAFDAEATNTALNQLKLEKDHQNKATAENRSSPAHLSCKNISDEVSASGPACSRCTNPITRWQIRKLAERQARNSQVMHGRVNASCLKHPLGKIWMYSRVFIAEGPPSSPKNLRRKPVKENAAAAAWCGSAGSSEHRGQQESLIPVCCHLVAQRQVFELTWS